MTPAHTAAYWLQHLKLSPHVEGGAFRETYRSALQLPQSALPNAFQGQRAAATGIYFLLEAGQYSAFHRIAADEMWHFYDGYPLSIYEITPAGTLLHHRLGRDLEAGEHLQLVIPAGNWFASRTATSGGFALVGCTVAPGFDFADFELASRATLQAAYPQHATLIAELTYA
ncbi:hypothetical protein GA0116948_11749 [Chitinophaga costaii]|uniref:DUF985 domain-containing protein n=1 Tax=Chitinophaga costaii TaxID=1335309 RepID=A0A1C4FV36_9BACT|nr:cupin domain-containing protein [Chitinophaga costaii]PUZ27237.1 cupin domain-containing protein [Chitinophaga costaii]SCC59734.1 hypothetical protein GA0116948_11749 [Chitinophaga costaii]